MIVTDRTQCDICGALKGETNHWFIAYEVNGIVGIMFIPADKVTSRRDLSHAKIDDICGQECAHKRLSQFLDTFQGAATNGNHQSHT